MIKSKKHYLEYLGARFLSWLASTLPLNTVRKCGRGLGWFAFSLLKIRRDVVVQNLQTAFPEKSITEIYAIALSNYKQFGMMMLEYLRIPTMSKAQVLQSLDINGLPVLDAAVAEGRGVIVMLSHFCNWEYLAGKMSSLGYPVSFMYQEQTNPYVDQMVAANRAKMNMKMVPRGMAIRGYMRALKAGECVSLLADQDAGPSGVFVDFMGREASTGIGMARFVIKTNPAVVFAIVCRDANYNLHATIEKLEMPANPGDEELWERQILQTYTDKLTEWIRRYPDHWFWMHRRWKSRPDGSREV